MKLISFLGTGKYSRTNYFFDNHDEVKSVYTNYIQEALIELIEEPFELVIVATKKSAAMNWMNNDGIGLKYLLDERKLGYQLVTIPDGSSQEELWEIFSTIYNVIGEQEEIIVDITHSFRSIPFMISSILNFSKEMKDIKVKSILYGAFESKTEDNYSPIFNLNTYDQILDWSKAVSDLLRSGNYNAIKERIKDSLNPLLKISKGADLQLRIVQKMAVILEEFFVDLKLSRGISGTEDGNKLKQLFDEFDRDKLLKYEELRPFLLVIDKLKQPFTGFSKDTIIDTHLCVQRCMEYGLYQQAYTLLRENIVNAVCMEVGLNIRDEKNARNSVERIIADAFDWSKLKKVNPVILTEEEKEIKKSIHNSLDASKAKLFRDISDYRNDLNHGEYRMQPQKNKKIIDKLYYFYDEFTKNYINI